MNFSQNRELICSNEKFRIYVDGRGTVYTDYDNVSEFPYNRTYFQDGYLRFRPMWEEVFLEILDEAQQRGINPAMNWLDCGAGCGIFLNLLEQKGYTKIRGIEPSAEACEMSEAVTNADIINEEPLLIPEELLDPQDVISLIDVLAHVPEPEEMLRWCYRHLKENALCIIKTPHRAPD